MSILLGKSLDRMESIMRQAERIVRDGTADDMIRLKPLRLQMAGAMTSCQMQLHTVAARDDQDGRGAARWEQRQSWDGLASEFRSFALWLQSPSPPAWDVYAPAALALFKRIRRQILQTRRAFEP